MNLIEPTPENVVHARTEAGLTQKQAAAAALLERDSRWSEYERGVRTIDQTRWEYFLLMTDQHPGYTLHKRRKT